MNLRILTSREELRELYEADLKRAFPPEELKPLSAIERLMDKGLYTVYLLEEDGQRLGELLLLRGSDGFGLIDYLAVCEEHRNRGAGAELLRRCLKAYDGQVLLGESEAPTGDPARDGLIHRRLGFYERNNARCAGYDCGEFGVRYKTLYWAEENLPDSVLIRHHQELYRSQFTPETYERYIQIPLAEGEALKPCAPWAEK